MYKMYVLLLKSEYQLVFFYDILSSEKCSILEIWNKYCLQNETKTIILPNQNL